MKFGGFVLFVFIMRPSLTVPSYILDSELVGSFLSLISMGLKTNKPEHPLGFVNLSEYVYSIGLGLVGLTAMTAPRSILVGE